MGRTERWAIYKVPAATCGNCYHEVYRPGPPGPNEVKCGACGCRGTLVYDEEVKDQCVEWELPEDGPRVYCTGWNLPDEDGDP